LNGEYRMCWDKVVRNRALISVRPGWSRRPWCSPGSPGAVGPALIDLDGKALNQHLTEAGRRTLGLRTPRRQVARPTASVGEGSAPHW
jgi:hypothetical protein